jgi:N-acetylmuramoyl-L-alanine amidase
MLNKRYLSTTGWGLMLACLLGTASAAPVQVQGVRIGTQANVTRVAFDLSAGAAHNIFTLSDPHRVVIDIQSGRMHKRAFPLPQGNGSVRGIRSANRQDGSVRIVLDLASPRKPRSFLLAGNGNQGDRLVVDLLPMQMNQKLQKSPSVQPRIIKTMPSVRPVGRDIVIAVDPGHGGKDPGAHGASGTREKDVVLRISRRLAKIIDDAPGMRAYLTRDSDKFVPLRDRMERARAVEADLFISIHADAFRDRSVRGATVYVLSSKGAADEAGRRLAARENAADLIGGVKLKDKDETLASVLMDLSQNASLSASIDIGSEIISEISQMTKVRKTKVQQAPFLVLKSPDVPSLLVETAFISNRSDEKNLGSSRYRERLAHAIFEGIQDYFLANPPAGSKMAQMRPQRDQYGTRHLIRNGDTLSGLADQYRVSIRRIRDVNNLRSDKIVVGKVLTIPPALET